MFTRHPTCSILRVFGSYGSRLGVLGGRTRGDSLCKARSPNSYARPNAGTAKMRMRVRASPLFTYPTKCVHATQCARVSASLGVRGPRWASWDVVRVAIHSAPPGLPTPRHARNSALRKCAPLLSPKKKLSLFFFLRLVRTTVTVSTRQKAIDKRASPKRQTRNFSGKHRSAMTGQLRGAAVPQGACQRTLMSADEAT